VVALQRFPAKSMGGESLDHLEVGPAGVVGDREWAVYGADGKLASGKHSRRFRRMDPVFELVARRVGDGGRGGGGSRLLVLLPDGRELVLGVSDISTDVSTDTRTEMDVDLSQHFGEWVTLRSESAIPHQDAASVSLVGTATLAELGRHEGDGRPIDPRQLRANIVLETETPFVEESWVGREVRIGTAILSVTEPIARCRMVGVAQVGVAARPGLLRAISDHHDLLAGAYAEVVAPGVVAVGDHVSLGAPTVNGQPRRD
jgi:uncharacterized protein YcbX